MKTVIIIPARYGSTRFPGKPLHLIAGKSLLQRVCETATIVANKLKNIEVYVATDDQRIAEHATTIKMKVILTSPDCPTGSDRALEAVSKLTTAPNFIVNFQGDAVLTPPHVIEQIILCATQNLQKYNEPNFVVTPAIQLSWEKLDQLRERKKNNPFSGTSVVFDKNNIAYWFSKNIIPTIRNEAELRRSSYLSPIYRHIGIYGYSLTALQQFVLYPKTTYEKLESLEQLRFLENNIPIKIALVEDYPHSSMSGIDSLEDATIAENLIYN